ncbi:MAG: hypothetical protein ACWA5U_11450 [bacterium]
MKGFTRRILLLTALFVGSMTPMTMALAEQVYRVIGVPAGQTLSIRSTPSDQGGVVVKVPHNASWFVLRGAPVNGWQQVSWNNQNGWVKAANLESDKAATKVKAERDACLKDPSVSNKICCGFPPGAQSAIFKSVKVYSVTGVAKGDTLKMQLRPDTNSNVVIAIPHNATWITKANKKVQKGNITWEKVRWNGSVGWVQSSQITFDPEMTNVGDMKREMCSVPAGCAPDFSAVKK